jgi:hypothetical protein
MAEPGDLARPRRRSSPERKPAACSTASKPRPSSSLRDRVLIDVTTYAFARIGAVVANEDRRLLPEGEHWWPAGMCLTAAGQKKQSGPNIRG